MAAVVVVEMIKSFVINLCRLPADHKAESVISVAGQFFFYLQGEVASLLTIVSFT